MWQKRADTDSLLHKTFRDLAEKEARSNPEKGIQNRQTAQKSPLCFGELFSINPIYRFKILK